MRRQRLIALAIAALAGIVWALIILSVCKSIARVIAG